MQKQAVQEILCTVYPEIPECFRDTFLPVFETLGVMNVPFSKPVKANPRPVLHNDDTGNGAMRLRISMLEFFLSRSNQQYVPYFWVILLRFERPEKSCSGKRHSLKLRLEQFSANPPVLYPEQPCWGRVIWFPSRQLWHWPPYRYCFFEEYWKGYTAKIVAVLIVNRRQADCKLTCPNRIFALLSAGQCCYVTNAQAVIMLKRLIANE